MPRDQRRQMQAGAVATVPQCIDCLVRIEFADRDRPTPLQQLALGRMTFWPQQRVVVIGCGFEDVGVSRHDVELSEQHDRRG